MKKLTSVAKVLSLFVAITGCAFDPEDTARTDDPFQLVHEAQHVPEASTSREEPCRSHQFLGCVDADTALFCSAQGLGEVAYGCESRCDAIANGCLDAASNPTLTEVTYDAPIPGDAFPGEPARR